METYEEKEFLTVQEVSEALGITKQAVYQKLNKNWSTFVQEIDGQKMLKKEVLQVEKPRDKAIESKIDQKVEQVYQDLVNHLKEENQRLINENMEKDRIIAEKDATILSYAEKASSLAEQFATLVEREQEISARALTTTGQAQLLHAMSGAQEIDSPDVDGGISDITGNVPYENESGASPEKPTWRVRIARWLMNGK